jgi:hypothetical protein
MWKISTKFPPWKFLREKAGKNGANLKVLTNTEKRDTIIRIGVTRTKAFCRIAGRLFVMLKKTEEDSRCGI